MSRDKNSHLRLAGQPGAAGRGELPVIRIATSWSIKPQRGWRDASDLDLETRAQVLNANGSKLICPRSHGITNRLHWYWCRL